MDLCADLRTSTGELNQNELSFQIDYFITADPQVEHMHNQFIAAVYGNVCRDPPEPGVAPWVSSNDKPTTVSKPISGNAAEQRLKTEVMQLPPKDRRRLKAIPEVRLKDPRTFYILVVSQFTATLANLHSLSSTIIMRNHLSPREMIIELRRTSNFQTPSLPALEGSTKRVRNLFFNISF